jgi:hypothetical protein
MILDPDDCERFFKLYKALTLFVGQRLKFIEPPAKSAKVIVALPLEQRVKVRDAFLKHLDLIDAFVEENPFRLDPEELDIVRSWHDLVAGEFYVLRFLKKYTVFLTAKEPTVAYGVVGLSEPFEVVITQPLPYFCKTVLLPYQGRIVYDGLLSGYKLIIGSNIRRELNDSYNDAKKRLGVVTNLPWRPEPPTTVKKQGTARPRQRSGLIGRWSITWIENWVPDFVDPEVEALLELKAKGMGRFQFGYVQGEIERRSGMASQRSSSRGTATMRWTRHRDGAGRFWTGTRSRGGSSSTWARTWRSGRSGRGVER